MNFKNIIKKPFIYISAVYFITRFINLIKLPIFNDESIYLDWASKELNTKGLLFYSLYDGKPPFLMWVMGIFRKFVTDPLFAGRLVSVIAGFLTLFGIYKLGKKYFNEKTAILAGIFYIIIPLFLFFDRQALMESAVTAAGIWSVFYFMEFLENPTTKNTIILGAIWGTGIFIKQNVLIFIGVEILIYLWMLAKKQVKINRNILYILGVSQLILLPLYLQKNFWLSLKSSSRFAMGIGDLLSFPINTWLENAKGIILIPYAYIFIPILILGITGMILIKNNMQKVLRFFFLFSLFLVLILSVVITPRYISPYLPLITVFSTYVFSLYKPKVKLLKPFLILISLAIPLTLSYLLIVNPLQYFETFKKYTKYSQEEGYVSGWTAGYATQEAIAFIQKVSEVSPVVVGVRLDAGNPESAIFTYFNYTKRVLPIYFDKNVTDPQIFNYECISTNFPFYFVARDDTLAGMDKFLIKVDAFKNPVGDRFVGIYTLKNDCVSNTLTVTF